MTVANDEVLQRQWAKEHGLATRDLTDILLAQIEEHRAEVVYSLNPVRWDSSFVRRLPACVKATIAFLASDSGKADLSAFSLMVSNFPIFLRQWQSLGMKVAYFGPSHDPGMIRFAQQDERPVDVSFVGTYSNLHLRRNQLLEECAALSDRYCVVFALAHPPYKPLVDARFLRRIPGLVPYLPKSLRHVTIPSVYGLEMYQLIAKSKVVINAAVDISEQYRGNMRCFEAMGCGAYMLSDAGIYPEGLVPGIHFDTFKDTQDAVSRLRAILNDSGRAARWVVAQA